MTFLQQRCERCDGRCFISTNAGMVQCAGCHGKGWRHVPVGYTQAQIGEVSDLIDALAVRAFQA